MSGRCIELGDISLNNQFLHITTLLAYIQLLLVSTVNVKPLILQCLLYETEIKSICNNIESEFGK